MRLHPRPDVRHAGCGRFHRPRHTVARGSRRAPARHAAREGRPADRLDAATADQLSYAAADVEYLLALHDALVERLTASDRLQWALDECEERRQRVRSRPDPETAWWRIKGSRQLRGAARGVAQTVAAWRERSAETLDVPPRYVNRLFAPF